MQIINEAKERVCLSLLNQVSACERLLEVAEQKENKNITKDLFLKQHKLLNRLEKVSKLDGKKLKLFSKRYKNLI